MMSIKTILVVENDPVSLAMYRKRLECEGYRVECAQDGLEATTLLSQDPPDLVLLDLMLPKLNGSAVLEFMHAEPRLTMVPVIILSNAPMTEVPPDSPLAQGTRRLVKGECTFATLLQAIKETLADSPELVVVEASAGSAVPSPAAGNGHAQGNGSGAAAGPDSGAAATKRRLEFMKAAAAEFPKIRENCLAYIKAPGSPSSQVPLSGLHQRVHLLSSNAAQAGCNRLARLTAALDSLLSSIATKPGSVTPSILQTIAQAVDCVGVLLKSDDQGTSEAALPKKVLIVDDDPVCNHVNVSSLKQANFDVTGVEDPITALRQMEASQFDLVVLDVNMPGITGFELCEKIRRLPHCKTIPVIFVTAFSNFDNRRQSVLSGGDDFVTKPVSPLELALKVIVHLSKARGQRPRIPRPETSSAPADNQATAAAKNNGADRVAPPLKPQAPSERYPASVSEKALQPMTSTRTSRSGADGTEGSETLPEPASDNSPSTVASPHLSQPAHPGSIQAGIPEARVPSTESANSRAESVPASETEVRATELCPVSVPPNSFSSLATSAQASVQQRPGGGPAAAEAARGIPAEFLSELESARTAAKQADQAREEEAGRCRRMGEEMTELRRVHAELQSSFTNEQQSSAKVRKDFEDIQSQFNQSRAELDKIRNDFERQSSELVAARQASGTKEGALKEKDEKCRALEKELDALRQAREDLQGKASTSEEAAGKLRAHLEELQTELQQARTELDKVRADFERQSAELIAATTATGTSEDALKAKEEKCRTLEEELTGLRQAREELQHRVATEEQASTKRRLELEGLQTELQRARTELDRVRADLEKQSSELTAAKTAAGTSESALKEREEKCRALEEELVGLRQAREERQSKAAGEEQAVAKLRVDLQSVQDELQQTRADLQKARADFEAQSAELNEVKETVGQRESELKEKETAWKQLEAELASLRQAHEESRNRVAQEEQTSTKLRGDCEALRTELQQSRSELEESRTVLQRQSAELNDARSVLLGRENTLREKETAWNRMEEELAGLQLANEELQGKLTSEDESVAQLRQGRAGLQEELRQRQIDLDRARADLERQSAELEEMKRTLAGKETALQEKATRTRQVEEELAGSHQVRSELERRLNAEEAAAAKARQDHADLQEQLHGTVSELQQARTDLQEKSAELTAAKSTLEEKDIWNGLLEEELAELRRARGELQERIAVDERVAADLHQEIQGLQGKLCQSQTGLEEAQTKLREQSAERFQIKSEYQNIADAAEGLGSSLQGLHDPNRDRARSVQENSSATEPADPAESVAAAEKAQPPSPTEPGQSPEPVLLEVPTDRSEPSKPAESAAASSPAEPVEPAERFTSPEEHEGLTPTEPNELAGPAPSETRSDHPEPAKLAEHAAAAAPADPVPPNQSLNGQTFCLSAPAAKRVLLTGDFTDWRDRAIPMSNSDGIWTATVNLPSGTYQYLFLVDDEWRADPECSLRAANSVGGYNMVRQVA